MPGSKKNLITSNVQQGEIGSLHLTHPEGAVGSV